MKNSVKGLSAVAGLVLAGGLAAGYWFYYPTYQIQNVVRDSLKDPDSAKFSKVMFNRQTGAGCGLVNAKNQLGGYVGNKIFVATLDGVFSIDPEATAPDLPSERPRPLSFPSINFSMSSALADATADLNAALDRGREIDEYRERANAAAAKNDAFKSLVKEKCPSF